MPKDGELRQESKDVASRRALAVLVGSPDHRDPQPSRLTVRQRVIARLRGWWISLEARLQRLRKLVVAVRTGHIPQQGAKKDFDRARLAYQIRAKARWAAAWVVPPVACVGLYFPGRGLIAPTVDVDALLRSVLPAASLAAGLLAAGLMNATAQSKELRRRRVDALRKCQGELQPLRHAFDVLLISFNNRSKIGEHLARFLDYVRRVGFEWRLYDGSDTGGRLIPVEKINDIVDALEHLSGILERSKHYRHLVEELGAGPTGDANSMHGVVLTNWIGVGNVLADRPMAALDSWRYLSFWQDLINETLDLAMRAQQLSFEVHFQDLTRLRAMFAHLTWLTVVGVAVPLVGLAFPANRASQQGLAMIAVVGMMSVLASTLWLLYRWITEQRLHNEGRLR